MTTRQHDLRGRVATLAAFIGAIWLVAIFNAAVFEGGLLAFGIRPRTEEGIPGILLAPLLHKGVDHLLANTAGLLVFGGLVMLRSKAHFQAVTLVGILASGIGVWLFGRPFIHVGASGIVFAYFGYLLLAGWFERRIRSLLLSIAVFLVWGPVLYGVLPTQRGISWEGHASGLLGGILAAWFLAGGRPRAA